MWILVTKRCSQAQREPAMLQTAEKVSSETAVCVTVIGREVSGGSMLGQEQVPVCGRSRARSPPPFLEEALLGQQSFFVLLAPSTNGLKPLAGSLATRQQFKSK